MRTRPGTSLTGMLFVGVAAACSAGDGDTTSSGSSTEAAGGGSSAATTAASGGGGSGTGGCPTAVLGSQVPIQYNGSTLGKPNIVESQRLEWETAGDDALLFNVPTTGRYSFLLSKEPSGLYACGASVQEAQSDTFYDPTWCPAPGGVSTIDGQGANADDLPGYVDLLEGQELLIWFSCGYFADVQEGEYTLEIDLADN